MIIRFTICVTLLLHAAAGFGQQADELIKQGNDFYALQQFEPAAGAYDAAMTKSTGALYQKAAFNKADALYKLGRKEEALKLYEELIRDKATEKETLSKSYYNKGVMLSEEKKLEESIEAYKAALRLNPIDKETRENLQKALLELKKKNPPQKKDQQQKKQQQKKPQQQQSKLSQKEAQRQLDLLKQKEKQVKDRSQKQQAQSGNNQKDW